MNQDENTTPPGMFRVQAHRNGGEATVVPSGELDLATASQLDEELHAVARAGCDLLVLDLRGLTFIDSSGVRLVTTWVKRSREDGLDFALTRGDPVVHRIFELTGLADSLPFRS